MGAKLGEKEGYLSIDYVDATNELYSWASEAAADAIVELLDLSPEEHKLVYSALTRHLIEFEGEVKKQLRGQLMGSIMSFPILCIVNAAVCRWAKEIESQRSYTLTDCPLAINGDDAILRTTKIGQSLQERISQFVGLRPSVGKVYFSRTFLNINSTTYRYHENGYEGYQTVNPVTGRKSNRLRHFELRGYVNLGLLYGFTRSGGSEGSTVDTGYSVGARCRDLIRGSPWFLREQILDDFIHKNYELLSSVQLPWFVPENLGGLGLPPSRKYHATDLDLRLARKIYEHPKMFRLPSKPQDTPWQTWRYATKRFPVNPTISINGNWEHTGISEKGDDSRASTMSFTTLLGLACVESLFRAKGIAHLYKTVKNPKSSRGFYTSCHRVYKKALLDKTVKLPEPFKQDNFPVIYDRNSLRTLYLSTDRAPEVHTYISKVGSS